MKTTEEMLAIPPEVKSALQEALANLAKGIRDPEAAKKAAARMDRMREETRKRVGVVNVAVDLIRELRDQ